MRNKKRQGDARRNADGLLRNEDTCPFVKIEKKYRLTIKKKTPTFPSGLHTLIPANEITNNTDFVRALFCNKKQ